MYHNLNPDDRKRIEEISEIRQRNNLYGLLLSNYLNNNPCFITKELMESANCGSFLSEETVYFALLTGFCGLDIENDQQDKQLANDYFRPSIKKLDTKAYLENPYYQNISIPKIEFNHWQLGYEEYASYEAFIYNDILLKPDFKEIPRIGFFNDEFQFPIVMENGHEWMAIKPNEIETMQPVIDSIEGRVVTFGLGLGYFPYMASLKEEVQNILVVERDEEVIRLFKRYILPQFQNKEKIEIVSADAFEYVEKEIQNRNFDYAFVDLWHDVSDGLAMYLQLKKLERQYERTKFFYWIEDSLLSAFRWQLFDWVVQHARSYNEVVKCLSNPFLRKLAATETKLTLSNY